MHYLQQFRRGVWKPTLEINENRRELFHIIAYKISLPEDCPADLSLSLMGVATKGELARPDITRDTN